MNWVKKKFVLLSLWIFSKHFARRMAVAFDGSDDGEKVRRTLSIGLIGGETGNPVIMAASGATKKTPWIIGILFFLLGMALAGGVLLAVRPYTHLSSMSMILQTAFSAIAWGISSFLISKDAILSLVPKIRSAVWGRVSLTKRELHGIIMETGKGKQ